MVDVVVVDDVVLSMAPHQPTRAISASTTITTQAPPRHHHTTTTPPPHQHHTTITPPSLHDHHHTGGSAFAFLPPRWTAHLSRCTRRISFSCPSARRSLTGTSAACCGDRCRTTCQRQSRSAEVVRDGASSVQFLFPRAPSISRSQTLVREIRWALQQHSTFPGTCRRRIRFHGCDCEVP